MLITGVPVFARPATNNLTVTAQVNARASIGLNPFSIAFADADPDAFPNLSAPVITVNARIRAGAAQSITLTVESAAPLTSGTDTIPMANLSWTVTGSGYVAGTMNTTPVNLGTWTGPGNRQGTQTYRLVNDWAYAPGNYSMTVVYTLSAV